MDTGWMLRGAVDLGRAAHPLPAAAVTALTTSLAIATGTSPARTALLAAAVVSGQVAVGLHNDLVDRDRDRVVRRPDKPLAAGAVTLAAAHRALAGAVISSVVLSFALGLAPAAAHLGAVAAAGAYNGGLKGTWASWVPYAVAFGLLPITVWLVSPIAGLPPWWLVAAAAVLGAGAHGANVLPDLADDRATGIRGLPHRLSERVLRVATSVLLLAGLALVTLAPRGTAGWEPIALGAGAALALSAHLPLAGRRWPLLAVIGIGMLAIVILLARGTAA